MASKRRRGKQATTASSDQVPDDAAGAELLDLQGGRRTLAQFWKDQPVVLVFLRHFG
jgi:hypothetical protein